MQFCTIPPPVWSYLFPQVNKVRLFRGGGWYNASQPPIHHTICTRREIARQQRPQQRAPPRQHMCWVIPAPKPDMQRQPMVPLTVSRCTWNFNTISSNYFKYDWCFASIYVIMDATDTFSSRAIFIIYLIHYLCYLKFGSRGFYSIYFSLLLLTLAAHISSNLNCLEKARSTKN